MKHLPILASTVTRFISICAFAPSSVFLSVLQASIKICLITARIKKYKSIIKKKRIKHNKKYY